MENTSAHDQNRLCRCGHAALVHTLHSGNCLALGTSSMENSHCLEFVPFATEVKTVGEQIAYNIRAELVCCGVYGRVNDNTDLDDDQKNNLFGQLILSREWHDLCYWGEASARIAEDFRA